MLATEYLKEFPKDQQEFVKKVIEVLQENKRENGTGLNITNIQKEAKLSHGKATTILASLSILKIVKMEQQGSAKVYRLAEGFE